VHIVREFLAGVRRELGHQAPPEVSVRVMRCIRHLTLQRLKLFVVTLGWEVATEELAFTFFARQEYFKMMDLVNVDFVVLGHSELRILKLGRVPDVLIKVDMGV